VNAHPHTTEDRGNTHTSTLGALLYANPAKARIAEADWVVVLQSIAVGDQRALRAIYERMHRVVFTLAVRILNSREIAEEVTLDVFHDVWRRAASYDPEGGTVVGWIMNQARSRAIDRLRFEQRKKRVNADPNAPPVGVEVSDSGEMLERSQQGHLLQKALVLLTPDERQVIETAFFSELTYAEAAVRLNQPLGTVKTRIRSGLGKLRQVLAREANEP
jgi:RNA polymerase sigma-70 factor (ECF subfamily)